MTASSAFHLSSPTRELIRVQDADLAVHRWGRGPPIVCLHATGHSARDFSRLNDDLKRRFEVIAIDWPGQGDSPKEAASPSAARYAALLRGAVDVLGLDRFILLGNSIGGAAAIIYAAAQPERVRGLVACNAGGLVANGLLVRLICRRMAKRFAAGERGDASFGPWFERYYGSVLPARAADWRRREIIADGYKNAGVLRRAWESFAQPDADIRNLTPRLRMPVLYAWARHDRTLPWAFARRAALRAPIAAFHLFDGGHAAFIEQPEAFVDVFVAFATRLEA